MLEELMDFSEQDMSEIKNPNNSATSGYQSFQKKPYNGGGGNQGNYNNNQDGFKGGFQRKEEVIEDPYLPVSIYIDRDFPQEIKQRLFAIASKLISKGITVRYNADDMDVHKSISELSTKFTEAYTPWKNFNEIDSKNYWNTKTSNHIAEANFQAWDKIPDVVKAMMSRNVRLLFGNKNNSITMCLITWSPDGASKAAEVTKETGRSSFIIKLGATYHFPVVNIAKDNAESIVDKVFNLTN